MDKFSLMQFLVTLNYFTLSMAFIDKLSPRPFCTVFGIHRLEGLLLSEFGRLSTIKSNYALPYCTIKEIDRFTFTLTFFKPQVTDSFPVEFEKAGGPFHTLVGPSRVTFCGLWLLYTSPHPYQAPVENLLLPFFILFIGR